MTVAPLVMAWGFGPGRVGFRALRYRRQRSCWKAVAAWGTLRSIWTCRRGTAIKHRDGLGWTWVASPRVIGVDRRPRRCWTQGVEHFMVEVGGEVRTAGRNHLGQAWRIGIEEPDAMPRRARLVVPRVGQSVATSGDYRIYFEEQGRRYSHTIDPSSGEPIAHGLASVTVVAAAACRPTPWPPR
jgi:thiamine biosynthesis lipoprotein